MRIHVQKTCWMSLALVLFPPDYDCNFSFQSVNLPPKRNPLPSLLLFRCQWRAVIGCRTEMCFTRVSHPDLVCDLKFWLCLHVSSPQLECHLAGAVTQAPRSAVPLKQMTCHLLLSKRANSNHSLLIFWMDWELGYTSARCWPNYMQQNTGLHNIGIYIRCNHYTIHYY